uniref:DUF148 domain-containing protein n=1 Tax=Rhabditophanes sp. KR3021 TaxID=114890 RepID=A0AC35U5C8_9BILA
MNKFLIATFAFLGAVAFASAQQGGGVPPFLEGAPPATVAAFGQLLQANGNKPDTEIDRAVEAWVAGQDASIKTKFAAFQAKMKSANSDAEKAHASALAKFSPEAKAADAKMSAIASNPSLSGEAKGKQIEAIMGGLSPAVKAEIEKAMQG